MYKEGTKLGGFRGFGPIHHHEDYSQPDLLSRDKMSKEQRRERWEELQGSWGNDTDEVELVWETKTVEARCLPLTMRNWLIYRILPEFLHTNWVIKMERFVRWVIRKPVKRVPITFTLGETELFTLEESHDEMLNILIDEVNKTRND